MNCNNLFYINLIILILLIIFASKGYIERFYSAPSPTGNQVVYLYWSSCGHCQTFMPEWANFEKQSITPTIKLETKDPGVNTFLAIAKQGGFFNGYPCIFFLNPSGTAIPYKGQRTAQALLGWQKQILLTQQSVENSR